MQGEPRQVALVTGGAVRVGRAISVALARAGYRVAINYHRSRDAATELVGLLVADGAEAAAFAADITDAAARQRLVAEIEGRLGPVEPLIEQAEIEPGPGEGWALGDEGLEPGLGLVVPALGNEPQGLPVGDGNAGTGRRRLSPRR